MLCIIYMRFIKRTFSTFKIYRNNDGKTRMDLFELNKSEQDLWC